MVLSDTMVTSHDAYWTAFHRVPFYQNVLNSSAVDVFGSFPPEPQSKADLCSTCNSTLYSPWEPCLFLEVERFEAKAIRAAKPPFECDEGSLRV